MLTSHALFQEPLSQSPAHGTSGTDLPRPEAQASRALQLVATATIIEVDGLEVAAASPADIIRSKEIADRPKDRDALNELRAIERRYEHHETDRGTSATTSSPASQQRLRRATMPQTPPARLSRRARLVAKAVAVASPGSDLTAGFHP